MCLEKYSNLEVAEKKILVYVVRVITKDGVVVSPYCGFDWSKDNVPIVKGNIWTPGVEKRTSDRVHSDGGFHSFVDEFDAFKLAYEFVEDNWLKFSHPNSKFAIFKAYINKGIEYIEGTVYIEKPSSICCPGMASSALKLNKRPLKVLKCK